MNTLLIYLFTSVKVEKGQKELLGSSFICYTLIFYEIGWYIIWNGGLNKKLNTIIGKECV